MARPDIETLHELIREGKTYREMAAQFGVSHGAIGLWLNADEETARQSARAREDSAEAWLDKGMQYLEEALSKDSGKDATAARALAQECARRAAIRNRAYNEKQLHEHTGANGGPIQQVHKVERVIVDPKSAD